MALVIELDVMLARRKMSVGDFANAVGITPARPDRVHEQPVVCRNGEQPQSAGTRGRRDRVRRDNPEVVPDMDGRGRPR